MRTTIDMAGRLVIPKYLRERLGLRPGEVELSIDGAGLLVEPVAGDKLVERDGLLLVPPSGSVLSASEVRGLRESDQR